MLNPATSALKPIQLSECVISPILLKGMLSKAPSSFQDLLPVPSEPPKATPPAHTLATGIRKQGVLPEHPKTLVAHETP